MRIKITTEKFIEKAQEIHGDKFDYSKVKYINYDSCVEIICSEHGPFLQKPRVHWSGSGCRSCTIKNVKDETIEKFVSRSKEVHGDKYDYSKVRESYDGRKVIIICKLHGEFTQDITSNLKGHGCHCCAGKAYDTATFIYKANKIHQNKYDYSKSEFINAHTKICIICPQHGEFLQFPCDHVNNKAGCSKCLGRLVSDIASFINQANIIHNFEFDYSKVEYVKSSIKIKIICTNHGVFEQTPNAHLRGTKCPTCRRRFATGKEFIEYANKLHNYKYDYSLVDFVKCSSKVKIICNRHGIFEQTPSNHLQPNGCPKCGTRISAPEMLWLDTLGITKENRQYKIGKRLVADGFDPKTNTVYEFYGDYWHGNLTRYKSDDMNYEAKHTFGELYIRTMQREEKIKSMGYNLVSIWEKDYLVSRQHLTPNS